MNANIYRILIIYGLLISVSNCRNTDTPGKIECESLPEKVLVKILGSAYNPRYMSVDVPLTDMENGPQVLSGTNGKRGAGESDSDFYVEDEFQIDLSNKPAWQVNFITETGIRKARSVVSNENRHKRYSNRNEQQLQREKPWFCDSKIRWHDLGSDYYPRWLRTVECLKHDCWYGKATCKPKSFTVKILKRQRGKCVSAEGFSSLGLIDEQKPAQNAHLEVWTWEERAVIFCCDCVLARKSFY